MENINRGPTFEDFVIILTEGSMQDNMVARLQSKRVQTPVSPLYLNVKYRTAWESLWGQWKYSFLNTKEKGAVGNFSISLDGPFCKYFAEKS